MQFHLLELDHYPAASCFTKQTCPIQLHVIHCDICPINKPATMDLDYNRKPQTICYI